MYGIVGVRNEIYAANWTRINLKNIQFAIFVFTLPQPPLPFFEVLRNHCNSKINFISSDRSSYSDDVLLYVDPQPLFKIWSIYANIYSFSF